MCSYCSLMGEPQVHDSALNYLTCESCKKVTCITKEEYNYFAFCQNLPVPFSVDWVVYKGETYLAKVNYQKSYNCRRAIIDLCVCLTYDTPLKSVNWNFENFEPKPALSDWKKCLLME